MHFLEAQILSFYICFFNKVYIFGYAVNSETCMCTHPCFLNMYFIFSNNYNWKCYLGAE